MSNVIAFPGARREAQQEAPPQPTPVVTSPVPAQEENLVRLESHTAGEPVIPAASEQHVAIRLDVIERMIEALSFYARFGWDEGKKAQAALAGAA